jgi:hypothetical protein
MIQGKHCASQTKVPPHGGFEFALSSIAPLFRRPAREEIAMAKRLARFFGLSAESVPANREFEPVYGLPRRSVEEWLARNPELRATYEAELQKELLGRQGKLSGHPIVR